MVDRYLLVPLGLDELEDSTKDDEDVVYGLSLKGKLLIGIDLRGGDWARSTMRVQYHKSMHVVVRPFCQGGRGSKVLVCFSLLILNA